MSRRGTRDSRWHPIGILARSAAIANFCANVHGILLSGSQAQLTPGFSDFLFGRQPKTGGKLIYGYKLSSFSVE